MKRLTMLASVAALALSGAASRAEAPSGAVIVARSTRERSLVVWDATQRLVELTSRAITEDDGLRLLTVDAVSILGIESAKLESTSVTIRVVYSRSRAAATYGEPSMAGKLPLVEVTAPSALARKHVPAWIEAIRANAPTPHLTVTPLSRFPTDY